LILSCKSSLLFISHQFPNAAIATGAIIPIQTPAMCTPAIVKWLRYFSHYFWLSSKHTHTQAYLIVTVLAEDEQLLLRKNCWLTSVIAGMFLKASGTESDGW